MKQVLIGSDHRGFNHKQHLVNWLREKGYHIIDVGSASYDKEDNYVVISKVLAEKAIHEQTKGILLCGSGIGVCIAANKTRGVRAGLCMTAKQAFLARNDDDINVLCLAADLVSVETCEEIITTFLETPFSSEERHLKRIRTIKEME